MGSIVLPGTILWQQPLPLGATHRRSSGAPGQCGVIHLGIRALAWFALMCEARQPSNQAMERTAGSLDARFS
jgi:hypothetical protein